MPDEHLNFYLERGLTIMPVGRGTKTPLLPNWTTLPRDALIREIQEGDNIGVRIERPLFVIDIDNEKLLPLVVDLVGIESLTVRTKDGYHVYLKAVGEYYPNTNKRGKLVQLLAEGCFVVAPPSVVDGHQYYFVNPDDKIIELSDRGAKILAQAIEYLARYEKIVMSFAQVWDEGHRHNLSLWLNGALRKSGIPRVAAAVILTAICLLAGDSERRDRLRALKDTYEKSIDEIAAWSKLREELEAIIGPERAGELISLLPGQKKKKGTKVEVATVPEITEPPADQKVRTQFVPSVITADNRIVEEILNDNHPRFLAYDPTSGAIETIDAVQDGEVLYKPITTPEVRHIVILPTGVTEYGSDAELFNEVYHFLKRYHYSAFDFEKKLDALYIMFTWIADALPIAPYRKITGAKGAGKSTWLKVMAAIAYRSVFISGASSEASLLRLIDRWKGTLVVDEADIADSSFYSTLVKALNVGFDRRIAYLTKCEKNDPDAIETFYVYGPKLVATRTAFGDDALESRFITTTPHKQPYARFLGETFEREAATLRNKLLLWRFRNLHKMREKAALLEREDVQREIFGDTKIDPRVAQILLPLALIADDELKKIIAGVGEALSAAAESEDESLLRDIVQIVADGIVELDSQEEVGGQKYLIVQTTKIIDRLDPEADGNERRALGKRIATILRSAGAIVKRSHGKRFVYIPEHLIEEFRVRRAL